MARIAGVDIPRDKHIRIALTYIYGIGESRALEILAKANIDSETRVSDLTNDELDAIRSIVDTYRIEGDLRRETQQNIKRLQDIGSYRGNRHRRNLPVRGQKTKNNAQTRKKRRTSK